MILAWYVLYCAVIERFNPLRMSLGGLKLIREWGCTISLNSRPSGPEKGPNSVPFGYVEQRDDEYSLLPKL
jgi:hypothetical protein